MSGRTNSDTQDGIRTDAIEAHDTDGTDGTDGTDDMPYTDPEDAEADADEYAAEDARRARWTAIGTGALLALAGLAAALLRLTGSAPRSSRRLRLGAAVCALAAVLGSRDAPGGRCGC